MNVEGARQLKEIVSSDRIIDLTAKTSLVELVKLISSSSLLIGNDTGAIHIGVASNVKTICISNGNHYGRFVPYPEAVYADIKTIFPPHISKSRLSHQALIDKYRKGSMLDINTISAEEVINELKRFNLGS